MKKLLLALMLSGLLFACGGNEDNNEPADEVVEQTVDSIETATEETVDSVEAAADQAIDKVEDTKTVTGKSDATTGKTTTMKSGGWTGKVVKLSDMVTGNYEALTESRVKELVMAGQYVGFLSNGTFYMVFNAGGNYDWKSLAKVAGAASVNIEGKVKVVNGISTIMATNVAS